MEYVVLVSHGQFAEGLKNTLGMFVGERDDILSFCLGAGEDVASLEKRMNDVMGKYNNEDSFLVLADIIGGSPLTTLLKVMANNDLMANTKVLGGMNLAMALNAALMKDKDVALNEGKEAVAELILENSNDEEEI